MMGNTKGSDMTTLAEADALFEALVASSEKIDGAADAALELYLQRFPRRADDLNVAGARLLAHRRPADYWVKR